MRIRWLGTAGFELEDDGSKLVIDPYFTRLPLWKLAFGTVSPASGIIHRYAASSDGLLVSHAHVDHLLDVPVIARTYGMPVFGSVNTCEILRRQEIADDQIKFIQAGDEFTVGTFSIHVFPSKHINTPGFGAGKLRETPDPPRNSRAYRMDSSFCFQVTGGGVTLLTDPGQAVAVERQVDVLLCAPYHREADLQAILGSTNPRVVIPTHWDKFWQPLSSPLQPMWLPAVGWPPIKKINLVKFTRQVERILPKVKVIIPEVFERLEIFPV